MGKAQPFAYISVSRDEKQFPLSRYLPPYYPGMASRLVDDELHSHDLLLDPLGSSPRTVIELAAQNRILVNCSNPILAFLISFLSKPISRSQFQSALADLSLLKRMDERLEEHLKSLYLTRCSKCSQMVQADYFLYHKGEPGPYARGYCCPGCGEEGQKPTTAEDDEPLIALQNSYPLHRSRALSRASTGSAESAKLVNEVLDLYPPRALYFIFTLLTKIETMNNEPPQQETLDALLLAVLDAGHSLNPWPENEESPRTLAQPEVFVERNLWKVLEGAVESWISNARPATVTAWPEVPETTGISLHRGRMRDMAAGFGGNIPGAILSTIPRPYAAFWTFSAVWSAWLWGKPNAAGFLSILERRRFDWNWHATALQSAFTAASTLMDDGSPVVTLLPEPSTGLTNAVFNGACASGWNLSGISCAGEHMPFLCKWSTSKATPNAGKANTQRIIRDAVRQSLIDAAEPQPYVLLHAAAMAALADAHCLPLDFRQLQGDLPTQISKDIQILFTDDKFLHHFASASSDPETGSWGLANMEELPESISDRVEQSAVEYLQQRGKAGLDELVDHLSRQFQGCLSPAIDQVRAILSSYAQYHAETGMWVLNDHDHGSKRSKDVTHIQHLIRETGAKLGYAVSGENPIDWCEDEDAGTVAYRLYTSFTACVGSLARLPRPDGCQYVYLFPGSRALLISHRIEHNALLQELTAQCWHFLKFRTMRHLAVRADLSREMWALLIDSDPISPEETTQLSMFAM